MKKGSCHIQEVISLNKVEGQVRGIIKMIEDERYCIDILNQVKAVKAALNSVELNILRGHVEGCVKDSLKRKSAANTEDLVNELMEIITKVKRGKL